MIYSSTRPRQAGVALITTMIVVMVAAGMAAAFLTLAFNQSSKTSEASRAELAMHVAESGIDDAINKLNAYAIAYEISPIPANKDGSKPLVFAPIPDYAVMQDNLPILKGSVNGNPFEVHVTNTNPAAPTPVFQGAFTTNYLLRSKGTTGSMVRDLEVMVSAVDLSRLFNYGLFGRVEVAAGGTFNSDGFKSSEGVYDPINKHVFPDGSVMMYANATGNLGSNGNISTTGNSMVMGNVTPGPGGSLTGGGNIFGSTTPAPAAQPLKPVVYAVPKTAISTAWVSGDFDLAGGALGAPVEYHASALNPSGKGTMTIKGDVTLYIDGDFAMNNQQALVIEAGGKLTIKQGPGANDIHINGQAMAGVAKAENFQIYSASTGDIRFNGGSTVYAAVYAPDATFTNNGGNEFFGALVANTMKLTGTASFHYDEDLAKLATPDPKFKIISWRRYLTGE